MFTGSSQYMGQIRGKQSFTGGQMIVAKAGKILRICLGGKNCKNRACALVHFWEEGDSTKVPLVG